MTSSLGPQFSFYSADENAKYGTPEHKVNAHFGDGPSIGSLKWDPKSGDVQNVHVNYEHQRKGVATGMWNYAQSLEGVTKPKHAPRDERTKSGNAWVKSVGGPGSRRTYQ